MKNFERMDQQEARLEFYQDMLRSLRKLDLSSLQEPYRAEMERWLTRMKAIESIGK